MARDGNQTVNKYGFIFPYAMLMYLKIGQTVDSTAFSPFVNAIGE